MSSSAIKLGIYYGGINFLKLSLKYKKLSNMKLPIITALVIFLTMGMQSMTVRNNDGIRNIKRTNDQQAVSTFKTALEKFTKCYKLKTKMMIKYRHRPRLARRIAKLTLEC